jgi:phage gpG-like protein
VAAHHAGDRGLIVKIRYTIIGSKEVISKIETLGTRLNAAARMAVQRLTYALEAYVKKNKLSGDPLHVRSGNLRNSVNSQFEFDRNNATGTVGTGIVYAAIQEFGGEIHMHRDAGKVKLREDVKGELLRQADYKNLAIFAAAHHKRFREVESKAADWTIHMPERSFLRSSLREMHDDIVDGLKTDVGAEAKK